MQGSEDVCAHACGCCAARGHQRAEALQCRGPERGRSDVLQGQEAVMGEKLQVSRKY